MAFFAEVAGGAKIHKKSQGIQNSWKNLEKEQKLEAPLFLISKYTTK